jgi:pheromone shutdown protein TraB
LYCTTPYCTAQAVLDQQKVESLRSDDAISALFGALSDRYPELVAPLIAERDLYLSWSLKRSKAVNGTRAVVGCVGKGHLRGIVYALKHDDGNLRFKDLVGGKNNRQNRRAAAAAAARRLLVELVLGTAAYAAWVAYTSGTPGVQ